MSEQNSRTIGDIGNYYGSLHVSKFGGKFWWSIENHDGHNWDTIPESLYRALIEYEDARALPTPEKDKDDGR